MAVGREFQSAPLTSFRMGRWDLHKNLWPLLAQAGVNVPVLRERLAQFRAEQTAAARAMALPPVA